MKPSIHPSALVALLSVVFSVELGAQPTAFTYQGQLTGNGSLANGTYDFRFTLFDSATNGMALGTITNLNSDVTGGRFTVTLDFGSAVFDGGERWIEIGVATNAEPAFSVLNPRQPITAAPYALRALNAPGGGFWAVTGTHTYTTNAGNVGIGTLSPNAKLHIDGGDVLVSGGNNFRMSSGLAPDVETVFIDSQFFGGGLIRMRDSAAVSTVELRSDPAQLSLFNAGGARVALNANSPVQGGSISLRNGDSLVSALLQGEEQSNFGAALTLANSSANTTISLFGDQGNGEARAGVAGDVGAGTTSPEGRLHVRGRANDPRPSLLVETLAGSPIVLTTSIELLGNALDAYFQGGPSALRLNPNSTGDVLLGLGGGNVGVNTVAPDVKLHVVGSGNVSASGGGLLVVEHGPSDNELAFDGNEIQARNTGSASPLLFNAGGGNVGIGITTPQGKLHVRSADAGVSAADTQNDDLIVEDSNARLGIYSTGGGSLGSSIALVEMTGNVVEDQWAIARETTSAGDTLWFTFGPSTAPLSNQGILALETNGAVFIDGALEVQGDISGFDVDCTTLDSQSGQIRTATIGPGPNAVDLSVLGNATIFGDLVVNGVVDAQEKRFRIDDPRDPANRYLRHYCHEGSEPQNVYNGVATLDSAGEATIGLPAYFAAINRDPRYSLTPIGAAMPNLHVAQAIDLNAPVSVFRVAGGVPGNQVSWEIKAIRDDPLIRKQGIDVEIEKQGSDRGRYLRPDLYGQPDTLRIGPTLGPEVAAK